MIDVPFSRRAHGWLVLARASNLPTVWSNCLAGWWLGGGGFVAEAWPWLAALLVGASALYTAGMFLNDVCDQAFDARFRPARPIVAGLVSRRAALTAAVALLAAGTALLGWLGWKTLVLAMALDIFIVAYDTLHKRTAAGLGLMAGCRLLLYPLAASPLVLSAAAWIEGALLASYVFGLSCLARGEHLPGRRPPRWPWWFIVLPVVGNAALTAHVHPLNVIVVALPLFWLARVGMGGTVPFGGSRVASLLAGIVLLDLSAVVAFAAVLPWLGWFAILFALALLFQRFVPAT
ncbi:MAG: hypothetical protein INR65_06525 [Gluconacetobacter diazotrophicus]|nr:hypothetical protein [Gluconacetobacter diazotrophicus]